MSKSLSRQNVEEEIVSKKKIDTGWLQQNVAKHEIYLESVREKRTICNTALYNRIFLLYRLIEIQKYGITRKNLYPKDF